MDWEQLPLPFLSQVCPPRAQLAVLAECPLCGGDLAPEHAHYRCTGCGWRDSCCD